MKTKNIILSLGLSLAVLGSFTGQSNAQVPADFPTLVVTSNGPVAPGDFIGTLGVKLAVTNAFNVVLDNSGTNPLYTTPSTALWRTVTPSGLIAENNTSWLLRDETFGVVATYPSGDGHDFKLLPNGDAILLEHESIATNLSQVVSGGRPDAVLDSLYFEELDAHQQIVFRWRAIDHLAITDSLGYLNVASVDWTHCNSITIDPWDNNYLVSLRCFCQIIKVSRTTGDVIWRLGGVSNNFTFIGENPTNGPYYFIGEHSVHGMANTNIMLFDNGSLASQGSLAGRNYSRAVQYQLDETNMTATLVWQYIHNPVVLTPTEGIVKRFTNGNTYVGWVSAAQQGTGPVLTEVNASNQVMYELSAPGFKDQAILNKLVWSSPALVHSDTNYNIAAGHVYTSTNSGVSVTVSSLSSSANNSLIVSEHDDACRFPQFSGKAPQVLVSRVTLASSNLTALSANLAFSLPQNSFSFDTPLYSNPTNLTIYQRPNAGQGVFVPLATTYDPVAQKLNVTNFTTTSTNLGEFIFTYPDLPEIPLPPILYGQGTQPSVDQAEPVVLQWTPRGFAHAYHLQVATNAGFSNTVVDQAGLTNLTYTLTTVQAGTTYFWRVNVTNYGGLSDWSTNSFAAAPPGIQVTSPNGGEAWALGQTNFIQWSDNISENLAIDLYKGATLIAHLTSSTASIGAYPWTISATNVPGTNYSIRVSSSTNAAVYGTSAAPFSIVVDPPSVTAQPTNQSIVAGNNTQVSATVTGAAPLSYQWRQNGTNLVNAGNISGATSNVLSLVSVTPSYAGNYTIVATNTYGAATSSVVTLTVLLPATITVPPAAQTIQCGSNASFSVTATGTAPLKYQWSLDGTALMAQTNTTLTLTNVHLPDHTVVVVVTNLCGSATNSTLLAVQDTLPPVITLNSSNPFYVQFGSAYVEPGATAYDLCAGTVPVNITGAVNPNAVGTNTVTYTASDGNGNANTATRTVIVRDNTPPSIWWSFTNLVLAANSTCAAAMPDVTGSNYIQATDLSLPLTVTQTPTNNASLPLGTNVVVLAVADACGNTAYSTNLMVVEDATPPVITLNGLNPITNELGSVFTDPGVTASDACSGIAWLTTNGTVNINAIGTNVLTYLAVDGSGNTNSVTRTVFVVTMISPVTLSLASSENPSGFKDNLNFTAAITAPNATGTIRFLTNGAAFDLEPLAGGSATSTNLSTLPRGTNVVTAIYSGDVNFLTATNSLAQIVTNHPPVVLPAFYTLVAGQNLAITVAGLATNWNDVDGDALFIAAISVSTNGVTVTNALPSLLYSNTNYLDDQFVCTISDGFGGTNFETVNITVLPQTNSTPVIAVAPAVGGGVTLRLTGGWGSTYVLESTTNILSDAWEPVVTNTLDLTGQWQFTDTQITNYSQRFFRLKLVQ